MSDAGDTAAGGMESGPGDSMADTFLNNVGAATGEPVIPIPEDDTIPDSLIDLPSGPVDVPSEQINVPSEQIDVPSEQIDVPQTPPPAEDGIDDFLAAAAAEMAGEASGPAASGPAATQEDEYLVAPLPSEEEAAVQKEVDDYFAAASGASGAAVEEPIATASGPQQQQQEQEASGPASPAENALPPFETNYQRFAEGLVDPELIQDFAAKNQQRVQAADAIELVKESIEEQKEVLNDAQGLATLESQRLTELEGIANAASETLKGLTANASYKRERLADFDEEQTRIDIAKEQLEILKSAEEKVRVEYEAASEEATTAAANLNEREASLKRLNDILKALELDEGRLAALQAELDRQAGLEAAAGEAIQNKETAISMGSKSAEEAERIKRELESKVEAMEEDQGQLATLEAAAKALQNRLTELETDKGTKEGELVKAKAAADSAKTAFDAAEQKDGALKDRLGEQKVLEELIAILSGENKKAADILKKRTNNIGSATTAVADLESAAAAAEARVTTMETDMAAAAEKEGEIDGLEAAIQTLRSAITSLEEEIRVAKEEEAAASAADATAAAAVKKREDLETAEGAATRVASEAALAVTTKKGEISGKKSEIVGLTAATGTATAALKLTTDTIAMLDRLMGELKGLKDEKLQLDADIPPLNTMIAGQRILTARKKKLYDNDNAYFTAIKTAYEAIKKRYDDFVAALSSTTPPTVSISTQLSALRTDISAFLTARLNEITFMKEVETVKASVGVVDGLDPGTCKKARYVRVYSVSGGESTMTMSKIAVYSKSGDNLAPTSKITALGTHTPGNSRSAPSPASLASFINGNMRQLHLAGSTTDPLVSGYWKGSGFVTLEFDREEEIDYVIFTGTVDGSPIINGVKIELRNGVDAATIVDTKIISTSHRIQCIPFGSLAPTRAAAIRSRELMKQIYVPLDSACTPRKAWSIKILSTANTAGDGKVKFSQIEAYGPDGANLIREGNYTGLTSSNPATAATTVGLTWSAKGDQPYARQAGTAGFETMNALTDRNQWGQINFGKEVDITSIVRVSNVYGNDSFRADGTLNDTATLERRRLIGQRLQLLDKEGAVIKEYTFRTGQNYEMISVCTEEYMEKGLKAVEDGQKADARTAMDDYIGVLKMGLGLNETTCKTVRANRLRIRPSLDAVAGGHIEISQIFLYDSTGQQVLRPNMAISGVGLSTTAGLVAGIIDGIPTEPRPVGATVGGVILASAGAGSYVNIDLGRTVDVAYAVVFGVPRSTTGAARMKGLRLELATVTAGSGTTATETNVFSNITTETTNVQIVPFCTDVIEAQFQRTLAPMKAAVGHPATGSPCATTKARYVRIFCPAGGGFINASQILIFDADGRNIIRDTTTSLKILRIMPTSLTYPPFISSGTTDIQEVTSGISTIGFGGLATLRDGVLYAKAIWADTFKSAANNDFSRFIEIDFGAEKDVSYIVHMNRMDGAADNTVAGIRYLLLGDGYAYRMEKQLVAPVAPAVSSAFTQVLSFCKEAADAGDTTALPAASKTMLDAVKTSVSLPATGTPIKTRYVRVRPNAVSAAFEINQVAVFNAAGVNIAKGQSVRYVREGSANTATTMQAAARATRLVDGNYSVRGGGTGFAFTGMTATSYVEIDLGSIQDVAYVAVLYPNNQAIASIQMICEFRAYYGMPAEYQMTLAPSFTSVSNTRSIKTGMRPPIVSQTTGATLIAGSIISIGTPIPAYTNITPISSLRSNIKSQTSLSTVDTNASVTDVTNIFAQAIPLFEESLPAADLASYKTRLTDNATTFEKLTQLKTAGGVNETLAGVSNVRYIRLRPSFVSGDGVVSITNILAFDGLSTNITSGVLNAAILPAPPATGTAAASSTPPIARPTSRTGLTNSLDPQTGDANIYKTKDIKEAPTFATDPTRYSTYMEFDITTVNEIRYLFVVGETGRQDRMKGLRVELLNTSRQIIGRNILLGDSIVQAVSFAAKDNLFDNLTVVPPTGNVKYNAALRPLLHDYLYTKYNIDKTCRGTPNVARIRLSGTTAAGVHVTGLHVYDVNGDNVLANVVAPAETPVATDPKFDYKRSIAGGMKQNDTGIYDHTGCQAVKRSGVLGGFAYDIHVCGGPFYIQDRVYGTTTTRPVYGQGSLGSPITGVSTFYGHTQRRADTNFPISYDPWTITDGTVEPWAAGSRHAYVSTAATGQQIEIALTKVSEVRAVVYFNRTDASWTLPPNFKIELLDSAGKVVGSKMIPDASLVSAISFCLPQAGGRRRRLAHNTSRKASRLQAGGGAPLKDFIAAAPTDALALNSRYTSFVGSIPIEAQGTQENLVNRVIRYVNALKTVNEKSNKEYTDILGELDTSLASLATKTARQGDLGTNLIPAKDGEVTTALAGKTYAAWTAQKGVDQTALTTASGAEEKANGELKTLEEVDLPALEGAEAKAEEARVAAAAAVAAETPMETLRAAATAAATTLATASKKVQGLETEKGVQDGLLKQKEDALTATKIILEGLEKKISESYGEGEEKVRFSAAEARALAGAAATTLSALQSNAGNVDAAAAMAAGAAEEKEKELESLKKAIQEEYGTDLTVIGAALDEARTALAAAEEAKNLAEEGLAAAVAALDGTRGELEAAEGELTAKQVAFRDAYGDDADAVKKQRDDAIEQFTKAFADKSFLEGEIPGLRAALEKIEADIELTSKRVDELLKTIEDSYSANVGGFKDQIGVAETAIADAIELKKGADDAFTSAKADLDTVQKTREKAATELLNAMTALQVSFGERGGLNSATSAAALKVETAEVEFAAAEEAVKTQQSIYGAAVARVEQEEVQLAELRLDLAKAVAGAGILEKEYRILRARMVAEELQAKANAIADVNAREAEIKNEANRQVAELGLTAVELAAEASEAAEIAAAAKEAEELGVIGAKAIEEETERLEANAADAAAALEAYEAQVADAIAAELDTMETTAEEAAIAAAEAEAEVEALKAAGGPEAEAELALAEAEAEELRRVAEEAVETVEAREAELTAAADDETAKLKAAAEEAEAAATAAKAEENAAAEANAAAVAAGEAALADTAAAEAAVENAKLALNAKEAAVEADAEEAVAEMEVAAEDAKRKAEDAAARAAEAAEIAEMAGPDDAAEASAAAEAAAAEAADLNRLADEAIEAVNAKEEELAAGAAEELKAAQNAVKEAEAAAEAAAVANTQSANTAAAEAMRLEEEASKALAAEANALEAVEVQEGLLHGENALAASGAEEAIRQNINNSGAAAMAALDDIAAQEAELERERINAGENIKAAEEVMEAASANAAAATEAAVAGEAAAMGVPNANIVASGPIEQEEEGLEPLVDEIVEESGPNAEANIFEKALAANANAASGAIAAAVAEEEAEAKENALTSAALEEDIRVAQEELTAAVDRLTAAEAAVAAAEAAAASGPALPNTESGENAQTALDRALAAQKEAEELVKDAEAKMKEIEQPEISGAAAAGLANSLEATRAASTTEAVITQKEAEATQKVEQAVTLFSTAEDTRAKEVQQAFKGFGERVKELRGLLKAWKIKKR